MTIRTMPDERSARRARRRSFRTGTRIRIPAAAALGHQTATHRSPRFWDAGCPRDGDEATAAARRRAPPFLNRELSQLDLIRRVLELAADPAEPLLERVKFCGIVSSILDEFFMVRVAGLQDQVDLGRVRPDARRPYAAADPHRDPRARARADDSADAALARRASAPRSPPTASWSARSTTRPPRSAPSSSACSSARSSRC